MKIVVNRCYGGYSLSREAYKFLKLEWDGNGLAYSAEADRTSPKLIKCVERLGDKASGNFAKLEVIEIPDGVEWSIEEYDGYETVCESHRKW